MPAPPLDQPRPDLRLRLVADTASVPGARRFITDGLRDWGLAELVDDAALCVTEMAANAALHSGSAFMDIWLHDLKGPVELAVVDQGDPAPPDAISPRTTPATGDGDWTDERATGRGLAIVSMLAREWGVREGAGHRRVWARLATGGQVGPVRPPRREAAMDRHAEPFESLPAGWKLVVLPGAPVELSLRVESHAEEIVRELKLIDARPTSPTGELVALITGLRSAPYARQTAIRRATEATRHGDSHVDLRLPLPRESAASALDLLAAVRRADELCREHDLLTLPATEEMDLYREWATQCTVSQLEDDAEPVAYREWLARREG